MRVAFALPDAAALAGCRAAFGAVAAPPAMEWKIRSNARPTKVLLLVSKFDHCLGDLLYRRRIGELPMNVVGIVGNHPREAVAISLQSGISYHHLRDRRDTCAVEPAPGR